MTAGAPKPARDLYGVMLLESGNAKEALAAFEATLKKEPNRLAACVGAAKATEKSGESAEAQEHYSKVVAIADAADSSRTEVAEARAFFEALRRGSAWQARHERSNLSADHSGHPREPGQRSTASDRRILWLSGRVGFERLRHRSNFQ